MCLVQVGHEVWRCGRFEEPFHHVSHIVASLNSKSYDACPQCQQSLAPHVDGILHSECRCPTLSTSLQASGGFPWKASLCSTTNQKRLHSMPARCTPRRLPPTTAFTSAACSTTAPCCCQAMSRPAAGPSPSPTST